VDAKGALPFGQAAVQLGLSEAATKSAVHRIRVRYREVLRDEIAQTVTDPAAVDDELRHLISVLAA
jgi:RNA polymerase sigma-70 factor (ECF subfamily)